MSETQDTTGSLRALVERWRDLSRLNAAQAKSRNADTQASSALVYNVRADELSKVALELEQTLDALPTLDSTQMLDQLRRTLRKTNNYLDDAQAEVERALDGMGDVVR